MTYEEHWEQFLAREREEAKFDPRPERRYRATQAEWDEIRAHFAGGPCYACLDHPWRELHHVLPRSQGGDDVVVNLVALCSDCHRRIEARDAVCRASLRASLMAENLDYLRFRLGETWLAWLDRNYQSGAADSPIAASAATSPSAAPEPSEAAA